MHLTVLGVLLLFAFQESFKPPPPKKPTKPKTEFYYNVVYLVGFLFVCFLNWNS